MELIIERHCVERLPSGLSPLQEALLEEPARVRVAEAPTGAGKSYTFLEAVARGERVLLMVPTRRLARNLAASLIRQLFERGWPKERAERAVAFWSSEQREALEARGEKGKIAGVRLRQMEALSLTGKGELIVAIPECVSHLLTQRRIERDQAAKGIFDLLEAFDHIVFDEFHTITSRGFGLAGLIARLATCGVGRAKVSFLSATPIDLNQAFKEFEIKAWRELHEALVPEGRALHGDVCLCWSEAPSLPDLIRQEQESILREIRADRQVVVIYDRLADLERDLTLLDRLFVDWGIDPSQVLVINSIRDSAKDKTLPYRFDSGRSKDPDRYHILIATASVELGITFRDARLLLMEPGFSPMNFLQRYGRAARRGVDGRVVVRADGGKCQRHPWLRRLRDWIEAHRGERHSITELTETLTREVKERFFGALPRSAAACGGIYWQTLIEHKSNEGPRRKHLLELQPKVAKRVHHLLQEVERLVQDREYGRAAKRWLKLLKAQALDLRGIGPKVRIIQEDGSEIEVDEVWLRRESEILDRFPREADGTIRIPGFLDDFLKDEKDYRARRLWTAYFPHTEKTLQLPWDDRIVEMWCRALEEIDPYSFALETFPEALAAAKKLVQWSRLVPGHDTEIPIGEGDLIL